MMTRFARRTRVPPPLLLVVRTVIPIALLACEAPPRAAPSLGQWIWTAADIATFEASSVRYPALRAGIWAGSIERVKGRLTTRLGVSPARLGPRAAQLVKVVRIEPSVVGAFDAVEDSTVARQLGEHLLAILAVNRPDAPIIQLDFDAPERLLPRWAAAVRLLREGPLQGRAVWITSIPAHVRHKQYGRWFRDAIDGHVLQVFDTGEKFSDPRVARLADLADGHGLPFQLGVGSFERSLGVRGPTTHRAWFAAVSRFAMSPWYRGLWVFPAGTPWTLYLGSSA